MISSDVVYPTGAMKDYEAKFWLPFKGTGKPVYAIPGNHDWYDALEAFAATFMTEEAARRTMRARVEVDNRLTSTTDAADRGADRPGRAASPAVRRADGVPARALLPDPDARLRAARRRHRGRPAGRPGPAARGCEGALDAARGKFTMAILGHPFYAGGLYQADGRRRRSSRSTGSCASTGSPSSWPGTRTISSTTSSAGDGGGRGSVTHVVNGGGGAYLSFGTALDWPAAPATADWAFYPTTAQVTGKIRATLPPWKTPFWWWTQYLGAWPFSVEWLSAAFDVNVAPFYQSFVEVRVEPSSGRVRLRPYGINGRLRWADLQTSPGLRPAGVAPEDPVEWSQALAGR